ncbi:MAG: hypothetical protein KGL53_13570, partial [Elusimicrobia bacterium]|nr:hypothetical protein [Elusimicrobiota bacterium]
MRRLPEAVKDASARLCVLPLLLAPVGNPDIFWHLAAAGRMLAAHRLPRDDAFSYTRLGAPWVDFEWLFELAALGFQSLGGWAGLWLLKAVLWALAAALVEGLGRLSGGAKRGRLLLVLWCAASLGRAELKPELLSLILLLSELWLLEAASRGRWPVPRAAAAAGLGALFFAAWANLHAGFAAGLAVLACYAALGPRSLRPAAWAALAAGALGTLANPYGWGVWVVLADHARWMGTLSGAILEWGPLLWRNGYHVPQLLLLIAAGAACAGAAA